MPGAHLWWRSLSDGSSLFFLWGKYVSLMGCLVGRTRMMHPGFCQWFRLWTSCPFRACATAGISKSFPGKLKFTENILTRAKPQLQGYLERLNFSHESPLQPLALNTFCQKHSLFRNKTFCFPFPSDLGDNVPHLKFKKDYNVFFRHAVSFPDSAHLLAYTAEKTHPKLTSLQMPWCSGNKFT